MARRDAAWVARHLGRAEAALFTDDELDLLAEVVSPIAFSDGHVLFDVGDDPEGVWIIQTGWVEFLVGTARTNGVIALLGPRQCAGDLPLILGAPAPYRARTVGDTSCLFIPANTFERLLAKNPKIALRWGTKVAGHTARMQGRVLEMLGHTLEQQVARVLLHEGSDGLFPFSQEMCAAMLGVSRAPVNQVLKEFERQRLVRLSYRQIELLNEKKLAAIAGRTVRKGRR